MFPGKTQHKRSLWRTFGNFIPLQVYGNRRLYLVSMSKKHSYDIYFHCQTCITHRLIEIQRHSDELVPVRVLDTLPVNILKKTGGLPSQVKLSLLLLKFLFDEVLIYICSIAHGS